MDLYTTARRDYLFWKSHFPGDNLDGFPVGQNYNFAKAARRLFKIQKKIIRRNRKRAIARTRTSDIQWARDFNFGGRYAYRRSLAVAHLRRLGEEDRIADLGLTRWYVKDFYQGGKVTEVFLKKGQRWTPGKGLWWSRTPFI